MGHTTRKLGSHTYPINEYFDSIVASRDVLFDQYLEDLDKLNHWKRKAKESKDRKEKDRFIRVVSELEIHLTHITIQLVHLDNRLTKRSPRNKVNSPYL